MHRDSLIRALRSLADVLASFERFSSSAARRRDASGASAKAHKVLGVAEEQKFRLSAVLRLQVWRLRRQFKLLDEALTADAEGRAALLPGIYGEERLEDLSAEEQREEEYATRRFTDIFDSTGLQVCVTRAMDLPHSDWWPQDSRPDVYIRVVLLGHDPRAKPHTCRSPAVR